MIPEVAGEFVRGRIVAGLLIFALCNALGLLCALWLAVRSYLSCVEQAWLLGVALLSGWGFGCVKIAVVALYLSRRGVVPHQSARRAGCSSCLRRWVGALLLDAELEMAQHELAILVPESNELSQQQPPPPF